MIYSKSPKTISLIADLLKQGSVCILPTDTVYGFSGIAGFSSPFTKNVEKKIRMVKGREEQKPFIQLIHSPDEISSYTDAIIPLVLKEKWPGALTIIVPLKEELVSQCKTIAFRCPGDEWLRELICFTGSPVYSTSVNRSGESPLSKFSEIEKTFGSEVDFLVDGGDLSGEPSTIVKLEKNGFSVIRQGSVII